MAYNGIAHVLLPDSFMSVVRKSEILADMQKLSQDLEKVIKGDVIEFRPKNNHKEPEKKNEFEEEVEKLNGMNKFDRKVRLNELAYSPNIHHRMISALHPDTSVHDLAELMQDQHPEVVTLTIGHPHVKDALDKVQNKDTLNNLRERWSMVNGHHETKKLLKEKMFGENGVPISDYWKSKTSKYKV
jgi:hypothetical protein